VRRQVAPGQAARAPVGPGRADRALQALAAQPLSIVDLEGITAIRRGRLEALLKILAVDDAVRKDGSKWAATGKPWIHDTHKWQSLVAARRNEATIMRNYANGRGCLMAWLQQALSDPHSRPCGRCSVCTGQLPAPGLQPDPARVQQARSFLRQQDVLIEPRKIWPKGCSRKGSITASPVARAVAFADDPGWSAELAQLEQNNYSSIPPELLDGAVQLLARWKKHWPQRPAVVIPAPAPATQLQGNRLLAQHISRIGKLPTLDCFTWSGPPGPENLPSTPHVQHLEQAIRLNPGITLPAGPVLLCTTTARSCWTLTVAAALLAETGARDTLALILHRKP
jgi:ATP-dependent DNA helicase RecQ